MRGTARQQLGQLSWTLRENRSPVRWRRQVRVNRAMRLPDLPRRRVRHGEIWAVGLARNEQDVVGHAVEHLLAQEVDHVLVLDNRSDDQTRQVLLDVARRHPGRVHLGRDEEQVYYQVEKMSRLVRRAFWAGADWVVPFDADEFWFAEHGTLGGYLRGSSADLLHADLHHMTPVRADPADLVASEFLLDASPSLPGKIALRSHPLATMVIGNHDAVRVGERAGGLRIAHALYRGPDQVARKFRQGASATAALRTGDDEIGTHWEVGSQMSDAEIGAVWERIVKGLPEPRIAHFAHGPMVRVAPLTWAGWDPDGAVGNRPGRWAPPRVTT